MKTDIILSGVGGQGIITIAAVIGYAALQNNLYIKQSEVHGMSQRGGAVQSHLRISDKEIASDIIPKGKADIILSVEPLEGLRHLPFLAKDGWLVSNTKPYKNINNYPDQDRVLQEITNFKNHILIDAETKAKEIKSLKSANIIMLGAAIPFININIKLIESSIKSLFLRKGEDIVDKNIRALKIGFNHSNSELNLSEIKTH